MLRAGSIALIYLLLGALWIAFSDRLLIELAESAEQLSAWQTLKGYLTSPPVPAARFRELLHAMCR